MFELRFDVYIPRQRLCGIGIKIGESDRGMTYLKLQRVLANLTQCVVVGLIDSSEIPLCHNMRPDQLANLVTDPNSLK
jgi:hypothetical protein